MSITYNNFFDEQTIRNENRLWDIRRGSNLPALLYVGRNSMFQSGQTPLTAVSIPHINGIVTKENDIHTLLSNVCAHRQMPLLAPHQITTDTTIRCPAHAWAFSLDGTCDKSPHYIDKPSYDGCPTYDKHLKTLPVESRNGLLLSGNIAIYSHFMTNSKIAHLIDFSNYNYHETITTKYDFNWKSFMELYLELYHVKPVHPGLGNYVDAKNFEWEIHPNWSSQIMKFNPQLMQSDNAWARYQRAVFEDASLNNTPAAIWITLHPNVMIEYYPHGMAISTVWPDGTTPGKCTNIVEYFFKKGTRIDIIELLQLAYDEAATEDAAVCIQMESNKRKIWQGGGNIKVNHPGSFTSPYEDGLENFYKWMDLTLSNIV